MTFNLSKLLLFSLGVFTGFLIASDGLQCYQCVDTEEGDTDCRNASLMLATDNQAFMEGLSWQRNKYYKECDKPSFNMCMIETFHTTDKLQSYHRGCTDGKTFSVDPNDFPRLQGLIANNFTTCTFDARFAGQHICVQLCDTDMCNGPKPIQAEKLICYNQTDIFGVVNLICGASSFWVTPLFFVLTGIMTSFGTFHL